MSNPITEAMSDDALRLLWTANGGRFHGPNVETGTMPETRLLWLLRQLVENQRPPNTPEPQTPPATTLLPVAASKSEVQEGVAAVDAQSPEPSERLGPQADPSLTIHQITGKDFCILVPNDLLPEDDMRPEESQSMLRSLWTAMEFGGWLFVDWGECHGSHSEAWFIRKQPETKAGGA